MQNDISAAKELIKNNEFDQAVDILNKYKSKDNWEIFFELGKIYYIKKQFKYSVDNLKESFRLNKKNIQIQLLLAKALKEQKGNSYYSLLKFFLNIRKNNADIRNEIDKEIISMLLEKKSYIAVLKYIDRYMCCQNALRKQIIDYLFVQIDELNLKGDLKRAAYLSRTALKKVKNLNDREKNILLNETEISDNNIILESLPRILEIELTERCNIKCRMCPLSFRTGNYKELTKKQISVLTDLFKYAETVVWIGGEPLLYKNIEKLFDLAHKLNIKQEIVTNGLLLTNRLIEKLIDYNAKITVSIDSVNKEIYENIRHGGKFEILLKNVQYLSERRKIKKTKKELVLNSVLSKWNYNYNDNFIEIINFAALYSFNTVNIYLDNFEQDKFLLNEMIKKFNLNRELLKSFADRYGISLNLNFGTQMLQSMYDKSKNNYNSCKFCLLPWKKMYLKFNGKFTIDCKCPEIGDFSANVTKSFLIDDIWNGEMMQMYRYKISNNDLNSIKNNCQLDVSLRKG